MQLFGGIVSVKGRSQGSFKLSRMGRDGRNREKKSFKI